ncbi:MAG: hypothetical protein LBS16_07905 [Prevotellaceae bacterium]|jgi:Skp family chaperone for outer membrane proteins|nr:hypothetical protein [Prevotellaceae bacterium]
MGKTMTIIDILKEINIITNGKSKDEDFSKEDLERLKSLSDEMNRAVQRFYQLNNYSTK